MHPQPKAVQASRSSAHITTSAYDEGKEWARRQEVVFGPPGLSGKHKIKQCRLSIGVYNYPCKLSYEQWQGRLPCLTKGPCNIYVYSHVQIMHPHISYTYGYVDLHHKGKSKNHNSIQKQSQLVNQRKHEQQKNPGSSNGFTIPKYGATKRRAATNCRRLHRGHTTEAEVVQLEGSAQLLGNSRQEKAEHIGTCQYLGLGA